MLPPLSLPPAPPAIETARWQIWLQPEGAITSYCHYDALSSQSTSIHSREKPQLSDFLYFSIRFLSPQFFHHFPPLRQSGWATSGTSLNKARVVQYFRMNNFKAFHNCWREILIFLEKRQKCKFSNLQLSGSLIRGCQGSGSTNWIEMYLTSSWHYSTQKPIKAAGPARMSQEGLLNGNMLQILQNCRSYTSQHIQWIEFQYVK